MSDHNDGKLKQAIDSCTPVAWQFFQDGKWHIGSDKNNHRANTEEEGFPVRDLCVCQGDKLAQPQEAQTAETTDPEFVSLEIKLIIQRYLAPDGEINESDAIAMAKAIAVSVVCHLQCKPQQVNK